jgi:hypothetical protein
LDGSVGEWDLSTGRLITHHENVLDGKQIWSLRLNNSLLACGGDAGVKLFLLPEWTLVNSLNLGKLTGRLLFNPTGCAFVDNV